MSSGIVTPPLPPPETPVVAPPTEYETFIDQRLRQTRRQVKGVDIAGGLVTLAIGVLGYLLAAALVDHWLIVGGLGFWGRMLLWIGLVGAAGTYFAYCLLPPMLHRINPVFAASTIEKSQPSLRNSLINFLLLRGRRSEVAGPVFQAMEYRAAADLSKVQIDVAVDRTHLVRLGCVLAGLVALFSLYLVLSPKNPLRSAARVLWPWSTIEAPTRVTIRDVQPGDATAFHGESVTISAEIAGLRKGESPTVIFSTADGQIVEQNIPMTPPEEGRQYQCTLPPGNLGLQQDYEYRLAAGDCRSRRYRIAVQPAPDIDVEKVTYHYPAYTGLPDRTVERQGYLKAIEGTEVLLHAVANSEIKPETAQIDLGCTGRPGVRMSAAGRAADGRFTLRLNPDDPARPEYEFYQLCFDDLQGRKNPRPIRYRIEVIRDQPPDVQLLEPSTQETPVAEDGKLAIRVRADPDFALRNVTLRAECDGRSLPIAPLLERPDPEKPWPGPFQATYTFEPAKLGVGAGNRVQYWVEAEDNKEPVANRSATDKRSITVIGPEGRRKSPEKSGNDQTAAGNNAEQKAATDGRAEAEQNPPPGNGQQEQQAGNPGEKGQPDQTPPPNKGPGEQQKQDQGRQPGQTAEKPDQRIDPEANPGDAFQKILQDREQQSPKQPPPKEPKSDQQQTENSKSDQQPPSGEQKQSGQQQQKGDQQQTGKQSSEAQGSPDEKSKGEKPDDKQTGEQQNGESGGQNSGEKRAGSQDQSGNSGSKNSGGNKQSGKSGSQDTGSKEATGQKKSGNTGGQNTGGKKAGDQEQNNETTDGKQAGSKQEGDKKPGNKNTANQKSNEQKGDGEQTGDEKEKQAADKTKKSDNENGTGEPPAGQDPDGATPGQEKPTKKPGADTSGGQPSGSEAGGSKSQPPADQQSSGQKTPGEQPPAQQQPGKEPSPKPDKNAGESGGSPAPQGDNKERTEKPGKAGAAPGDKKKDDAQSPSISNHQSTAQGDTAGDRSGAGEQGGGQQSKQSGVGGPGSHTTADEGGSKANEKSEGETGTHAGDQAAAQKPTGNPHKAATGGHAGDKATPGGQSEGGTPQEHPTNGGSTNRGTSEAPNAHGSANPATGGKPGTKTDSKPPEPMESPADEANLDYARRQTELALEHLRDQLDKEKPELLDRLGWTKDDARRFLEQWEGMKRAAAEEGAKGEAARKQFNDAVRSLGLRPRGTELRHGDVAPDQPENLRDAGRFPPPPDWAEQFRAYTRGVAGEERKSEKK